MTLTTQSASPRARLTAIVRRSLIVAGMAVAVPATAHAHDEGTLKLVSRTLAVGDSIAVTGIKFSKNSSLRLMLVGLGGRYPLTNVKVNAKGAFERAVLVPTDAPTGAYRLVALADDGDEAAALDVALVPPSRVSDDADHHLDVPPGVAPTGQALLLAKATSPWVTGGAVSLILLALAAAGVLLRSRRIDS